MSSDEENLGYHGPKARDSKPQTAETVLVERFRKKPVVIEAYQFTRESMRMVNDIRMPVWLKHAVQTEDVRIFPSAGSFYLVIKTLEGPHEASLGDWIIRGIKGEIYPCKPDIFTATYEPADQPLPREGEWVTVSREHLESLAHQLKGLGSWNSSVFQCISRGEQIGGDISAMLAAAPPPHDGRGEVESKEAECEVLAWNYRQAVAANTPLREAALKAEAQLADVRDAMILAMNNRDEWMELAHKTNAQFAEAKGEVERLKAANLHGPWYWRGRALKAEIAADVIGQKVTAIATLTAQRDRLLEAGKPFVAHADNREGFFWEAKTDDTPILGSPQIGGIVTVGHFRALRKAHDGVEGEG